MKNPTCYSCKHFRNEGYWAEGQFQYRCCMKGHNGNVREHHPPIICSEFEFSKWRNYWACPNCFKIDWREANNILDVDYQKAMKELDKEFPGETLEISAREMP